MKIRMLQTRYGSEDGFVVRLFHQNKEYEIADSLAAHFVRIGAAIINKNSGEKYMSHNRNRLLARVTAPICEPVSLAEAKLYLRVDSTVEDALISDLIVAARMSAESFLKSSLITQVWKLVYNDYVDGEVPLPMSPVANIVSVVIIARDASTSTVPAANYYLNAAKNKLIFDSQVVGFSIEITYNAGYGNAAQVPLPIKYGILAHIAAMYDERGVAGVMGQANFPPQTSALYAPFREVVL